MANPLRTPQARTADKRAGIEAAAATLFAARGFEGVSLREVATAAEVHLGTMTYLYADKQALYDTVVAAALDHFGTGLLAAVRAPGDPQARLAALIGALVRLHAERTVPGQIVAREMVEGASSRMAVLGRGVFVALREAINPLILALGEPGLSQGEADRMTGRIINMAYAAARSGDLYAGAFGQLPQEPDAQIAEITRMILHGLISRVG